MNFTCAHTFAKRFHKLAHVRKMFLRLHTILSNVQNTNAQFCKCAKNRRAQNAQICSATFFPNADFAIRTKTQMHISALCTISEMQIC